MRVTAPGQLRSIAFEDFDVILLCFLTFPANSFAVAICFAVFLFGACVLVYFIELKSALEFLFSHLLLIIVHVS